MPTCYATTETTVECMKFGPFETIRRRPNFINCDKHSEEAILNFMFYVLKHIWPFLLALPSRASWLFHVKYRESRFREHTPSAEGFQLSYAFFTVCKNYRHDVSKIPPIKTTTSK